MKKIPIRVVSTQDPNDLYIRFFPTDICNFDCSYCFPDSHPGKNRYPKDIDLIIKNFIALFDFYKTHYNKQLFRLNIAGGGEPTLWPHLEKFCKEIKEKHNVYITLTSNSSRSLRWWKENVQYFDDIILSCHNEFVDIDHYVDVADLCFESGLKVVALMLMDAQAWDKCMGYVDKMQQSKYPWFMECKAIVDTDIHGMGTYTDEQLEFLKSGIKRIPDGEWMIKHIDDIRVHESVVLFGDGTAWPARQNDLIINQWVHFYNWNCNISNENIRIYHTGELSGNCGLPLFENTSWNIFTETFADEFKFDQLPPLIKCPKVMCTCQSDTHISKFK